LQARICVASGTDTLAIPISKRFHAAHTQSKAAWKLVNAILPGPGSRFIPQGAVVHWSVIERIAKVTDYKPKNIPAIHSVEGSAPEPATKDNI
jgi:hypothetical protein